MAKIEPVVYPLNEGTANELYVQANNVGAEAITCNLYYEIKEVFEYPPDENFLEPRTTIRVLRVGNIEMTPEEFANWGQDNYYLLEIVAEKLGITLI